MHTGLVVTQTSAVGFFVLMTNWHLVILQPHFCSLIGCQLASDQTAEVWLQYDAIETGIQTFGKICLCTCLYTYAQTHRHGCICTHANRQKQALIHAHTHTHTCTQTQSHINLIVCTNNLIQTYLFCKNVDSFTE